MRKSSLYQSIHVFTLAHTGAKPRFLIISVLKRSRKGPLSFVNFFLHKNTCRRVDICTIIAIFVISNNQRVKDAKREHYENHA